jgi:transcription elongation factor GreA
MAQDKVRVTQEGYDELKKEQEHLIHVVRREVIEDLQAARAQGDLSENADYDAARDRQARIEARIRELESIFNNIEVIDIQVGGSRIVKLGAQVTIESELTGEKEMYTVVSSVEADPMNGKLSNVTPLAVALMDRAVSDEWIDVEVVPRERVRIVHIK